jgi:hypothetical protein
VAIGIGTYKLDRCIGELDRREERNRQESQGVTQLLSKPEVDAELHIPVGLQSCGPAEHWDDDLMEQETVLRTSSFD